MEIFTIILAGLFAAIAPLGTILDKTLENFLRSRVHSAESVSVRLDNTPSYSLASGHLDHLRIATRGIEPLADFRLQAVELETDPIDINIADLQTGHLRESLRRPLQAALRVEIKESDLNQALASPKLKAMLQKLLDRAMPPDTDRQFEILEIETRLLPNNTISITTKLQQNGNPKPLQLSLACGLRVQGGHILELTEPSGVLNGRKLSPRLLKGFAEGINQQLDLGRFEKSGITARVLQLKIEQKTLYIALFLRLEPVQK
jgi:hypothetical protein